MEGWLLGTEAFVELLSGKADPTVKGVIQWAKARAEASLYVSEMTWAVARSNAEASSGLKRQQWLDLLDREAPRQFGTRLLPVDHALLEIWSRIANEPVGETKKPARIDESMEVATAVQYSLTYVVRESALAAKVRCPTESPWS
jgi:hypothetical protein